MNFLSINNSKHQRGQSFCDECLNGYPRRCRCSGYIHAEHIGQNLPSKYLCDKCGDKFVKNTPPPQYYKPLVKNKKPKSGAKYGK
jgi:hypothetical protein